MIGEVQFDYVNIADQLKLARRGAKLPMTSRDAAIQALLSAAEHGDATRVSELLDAHGGHRGHARAR